MNSNKSYFLVIAMMLVSVMCAHGQLKVDQASFKKLGEAQSTSGQDLGAQNMLAQSIDWPLTADGKDNVACVMTYFENVPSAELENISYSITPQSSIQKQVREDDTGRPVIFFFVPTNYNRRRNKVDAIDYDLEYRHETYGSDKLLLNGKTLDNHAIYTVVVRNSKLVTININSVPEGADIYLDGKLMGKTDLAINNVTLGKHELSLGNPDPSRANSLEITDIEVSETKTLFEFNLLKRAKVVFNSNPKDALLTVHSGQDIIAKGKAPLTVEVPYGQCTVEAEKGFDQVSKSYTIGANTRQIEVSVIPERLINIIAFRGNQESRDAAIMVDGVVVKKENGENAFTPYGVMLPYGKHNIEVSVFGDVKRKTVNVDAKSPAEYSFKFKAYHIRSRHNIFDIDYRRRDWGIDFSYLNRHYSYKANGQSTKHNKWGEENETDNGIQAGISYHPSFKYGQGLKTGIYWQYFWGGVDFDDGGVGNWEEHDLYIPLQYQPRLPLGEEMSVFVNGGIACSIGLSNTLKLKDDDQTSFDVGFGYNEQYDVVMPDAVQWSVPIGIGFQWKALMVEGKYSFGLTENKTYMEYAGGGLEKETFKMNMWQVGIGVVF